MQRCNILPDLYALFPFPSLTQVSVITHIFFHLCSIQYIFTCTPVQYWITWVITYFSSWIRPLRVLLGLKIGFLKMGKKKKKAPKYIGISLFFKAKNGFWIGYVLGFTLNPTQYWEYKNRHTVMKTGNPFLFSLLQWNLATLNIFFILDTKSGILQDLNHRLKYRHGIGFTWWPRTPALRSRQELEIEIVMQVADFLRSECGSPGVPGLFSFFRFVAEKLQMNFVHSIYPSRNAENSQFYFQGTFDISCNIVWTLKFLLTLKWTIQVWCL